MYQIENKIKKFNILLIYLLPISLIFSTFLSNFIFIFISITFLIFNFKKKINIPNWILYFLVFGIYLIFNPANFLNLNENTSQVDHILKIIFFLRFPIFFLAVTLWIIEDKKKFTHILILSIISISFVSIDIIYQYYFNFDIFGFEAGGYNEQLNIYYRHSGPFGEELIGGSFLYKSIIICLSAKFFFNNNSHPGIFYVLTILVMLTLLATFFSGERVSAFKILMLSLIFYFFYFKTVKKKLIFIFLIILLPFTIFTVNDDLKNRYINQTKKEIGSLNNLLANSNHFKHYKSAYIIFKNNKIFGTGTRSFRYECEKVFFNVGDPKKQELIPLNRAAPPRIATQNKGCITHPHNYLFEIASDAGIIGIVLFMMFAFSFAVYFFKKNKLILLYGFIFYFPFLPSGSFYASWDNMIFWFTLSILFMFKNYYNENARKLS